MKLGLHLGVFSIEQDIVGFKTSMILTILISILIDIFAYLHFNDKGDIQFLIYAIILSIEAILTICIIRGEKNKNKKINPVFQKAADEDFAKASKKFNEKWLPILRKAKGLNISQEHVGEFVALLNLDENGYDLKKAASEFQLILDKGAQDNFKDAMLELFYQASDEPRKTFFKFIKDNETENKKILIETIDKILSFADYNQR